MDLELRVERLERENRRLKRTIAAVLVVLGLGVLLGAVHSQQVSEVLKARRFELVDEGGEARGIWTINSIGNAMVTLRSNDAEALLSPKTLAFHRDDLNDGQAHQAMAEFYGIASKTKAAAAFGSFGVIARDDGATVSMLDADGALRARLGRVYHNIPATGAENTYPAAVALYDAEGNVIWMAPR